MTSDTRAGHPWLKDAHLPLREAFRGHLCLLLARPVADAKPHQHSPQPQAWVEGTNAALISSSPSPPAAMDSHQGLYASRFRDALSPRVNWQIPYFFRCLSHWTPFLPLDCGLLNISASLREGKSLRFTAAQSCGPNWAR